MIAAGKEPAVAAELERRIRIVERDERDDDIPPAAHRS